MSAVILLMNKITDAEPHFTYGDPSRTDSLSAGM